MQRYELVDNLKLFWQKHKQKKTRYVHQVNVSVLYSMLKESFDDSGDSDFEEWIDIHRKKVTHFEF